MKRLLPRSNYHKGLNNLRKAFAILPLLLAWYFINEIGITLSYAAEDQQRTDTSIAKIVTELESLNSQRTFPPKIVTIKMKDTTEMRLVFSHTAEEILDEAGILVDYDDLILPSSEEAIADGGTIELIKVRVELMTKTEDVPFTIEELETDDLNSGTIAVAQEGVLGVREKDIRVIYENGVAVRSEVIGSRIIEDPVKKIIEIGTKTIGIRSCGHWGSVIDHYVKIDENPTKNRWMKEIMWFESGCDSGNTKGLPAKGLFQFMQGTFDSKSVTPDGQGDIWDGRDQILAASRMYDQCRQKEWGAHNNVLKSIYPKLHEEVNKSCVR